MDSRPAWAARIREARRARMWSQRDMARRIHNAAQPAGVAVPGVQSLRQMVSDWEAGRHRPSDLYRTLYSRAFDLPESVLFGESAAVPLSDDEQPAATVITDPQLPWVWDPKATVAAVHDLTKSDLMLDRRQAVKALTVTAGVGLTDPVQRWMAKSVEPSTGHSRIGLDEVVLLERDVQIFRAWDHAHGGGLRRKAVIGQLNAVAELLRDTHSRDITIRLFGVMAQLAKIAGTMSWDCGLQSEAQKYYALAIQANRVTGDRSFGASVLASMARQMIYLDKPQDALELIRLALDGVHATATPRLLAMLRSREAWAYAALGRPEAFVRVTDSAWEIAEAISSDKSSSDPEWIAYFDQAELAGVTGGRYLDLARHDPRYASHAVTHITKALSLRAGGMRSRALDQAGLAHAHLINGDLDAAVAAGIKAAGIAQRVHSDRVREQMRLLYREITMRRDPLVDDLRHLIRETLAG